MTRHKQRLEDVARIREERGQEFLDSKLASLLVLTEELDSELEGVRLPKSADAILNGLASIQNSMGAE